MPTGSTIKKSVADNQTANQKSREQTLYGKMLALAANHGITYNMIMQSPILVLLLTINLLACPVRCVWHEPTAAVETAGASVACSCCSLDDCDPISETPQPCGEDCCCQDCICEGATNDSRVELSDVQLIVSWELPTHLPGVLVEGRFHLCSERSLVLQEHLLHGRDRCIALQSWLI